MQQDEESITINDFCIPKKPQGKWIEFCPWFTSDGERHCALTSLFDLDDRHTEFSFPVDWFYFGVPK